MDRWLAKLERRFGRYAPQGGWGLPQGSVDRDQKTTPKLADGAVGTAKLAGGAVTNAKLSPDSVTSDNIVNGSVGGADLALDDEQRRDHHGAGVVLEDERLGDLVDPSAGGVIQAMTGNGNFPNPWI